jgi:hypothetical protein
MIQVNELRIGNYYMFADYDGIVYRAVKEIKYNQFGLQSDYDGVNFEICRPIPITEEWLIKLGFKKDNSEDDYIIEHPKDIVKYVLTENVLGIGLWILGVDQFYDKDYKYFSWDIKFVHQLQNLYFALTQKELTL